MEKAFWKQTFGNISLLRSTIAENDVLAIKTRTCILKMETFLTCSKIFQRKYFSEFLINLLKIISVIRLDCKKILLNQEKRSLLVQFQEKLRHGWYKGLNNVCPDPVSADTHIFCSVLSYLGSHFLKSMTASKITSLNFCCFTKYKVKTCKNNEVY